MKKTGKKSEAEILRQKAVALLNKKPSRPYSQFSEGDLLKLIHELEVHQIELELQNEELIMARCIAQEATQKYTELYDFAPSGYFSLSKEGEIIELNICGAMMLGKERERLKNNLFGFFISDNTKPIFNLFFDKVLNCKAKESCEVDLLTKINLPVSVYITGIASENGEQCLVNVVDITDRKLVVALKKKSEELVQFNILMVGREIRMIELKREINNLLKKSGEEEKYVIHV